jgi:hypothetical protein
MPAALTAHEASVAELIRFVILRNRRDETPAADVTLVPPLHQTFHQNSSQLANAIWLRKE